MNIAYFARFAHTSDRCARTGMLAFPKEDKPEIGINRAEVYPRRQEKKVARVVVGGASPE